MGKAFHGVRDGDGGSGVEGSINDTITALTEQFYELQRTVVDEGAESGRGGEGGVSSGHRKNNVRRGRGRGRGSLMDVRGGKASASAGNSDGEGENGGERVLFISDVNVTGFRLRHGEHEAEMMQPRF